MDTSIHDGVPMGTDTEKVAATSAKGVVTIPISKRA
jgi:hypothetical protein